MIKYAYAERVVKKVRSLLRNFAQYKDILAREPMVVLDGNTFMLHDVYWNLSSSQISVTSTEIIYSDLSVRNVLMSYQGFDGLLAL